MSEPQPSDLESAIRRVTSPPILWGLAAVLAVGTAIVQATYLATRVDPAAAGGEPGTGDFLAFYTGASLVASGRGAELYDFAAQTDVQRAILGGVSVDWFQGYLNPPLLAAVLAPTVRFGFVGSFFAFDALSVGAFLAAAWAIGPTLAGLAPRPADRWTALALVYACPAIARVLVGGQNTAITLALIAGVYAASQAGRPVVAGLLLGLLTYKPQFALLIGLAFLWRRDVRVVAAAAVVGGLHGALGVVLVGPRWVTAMAAGMADYGPRELAANAGTHFSWVRAVDHVLPSPIDTLLTIAGLGVIAAVVGRSGRRFASTDPGFGPWFALVVLGAMLASPHLQYYDVGVMVLPVLLLADDAARRGPLGLGGRVGVAAAWALAPLWALEPRLGFQPLTVGLVVAFALAAQAVARHRPALAPIGYTGRPE